MRKLALLLFLLCILNAAGQPLDSTNKKSTKEADSTVNLYFASVGETSAIHNGRVFYWYPNMQGHAFYPSADWQNGSVFYDGTWCHDLSMLYDIYKGEVLIKYPNSVPIRLFSERVQAFGLEEQSFLRLHPDKDNVLNNGFYQLLTEGTVTIFVARQKRIEENIVDFKLVRKFVQVDLFYVLKDGKYYQVNNQKYLLTLLKDSRQSISKFIRKQKLKYKKEKEKTIVEIAKFYNQSKR